MIILTEQQRLEALKACDGTTAALEKQEQAWNNILRIFENLAKGRDPNDGIKPTGGA